MFREESLLSSYHQSPFRPQSWVMQRSAQPLNCIGPQPAPRRHPRDASSSPPDRAGLARSACDTGPRGADFGPSRGGTAQARGAAQARGTYMRLAAPLPPPDHTGEILFGRSGQQGGNAAPKAMRPLYGRAARLLGRRLPKSAGTPHSVTAALAAERRQGARHRACPPPGNRGADLGGRLS